MAVNVSALQLSRGDLPAVVERVLAESRLPAERLELELTESVIMAGTDHTTRRLEAFRKLGVSLAVDDFGTGYSSLAYLKRLPITTLKIDKEFVRDITHDPDDAAITTTVIAMAHAMEPERGRRGRGVGSSAALPARPWLRRDPGLLAVAAAGSAALPRLPAQLVARRARAGAGRALTAAGACLSCRHGRRRRPRPGSAPCPPGSRRWSSARARAEENRSLRQQQGNS